MLRLAGVFLLSIVLTGCASNPWNAQNYAGITHVQVQFQPILDEAGRITGHYVSEIKWWDGKEKQDLNLQADVPKGTIEYRAGGVRAFEAFKSRAEAEKAIADAFAKFGSESIKGITETVIKALGLP